MAQDKNYDDGTMLALEQALNTKGSEKYAEQISKKLAVQEAQLEAEQKRIETQISVVQADLEAVQNAEAQAIKNATPKFAGVG